MDESPVEHIPVLADTIAQFIHFPPDAVVVDATLGQGGHSFLLGSHLNASGTLIAFDIDPAAIEASQKRLSSLACTVHLQLGNFATMTESLSDIGCGPVDFMLADLGYSSTQLADEDRGLSFQSDMPLDMRIDPTLGTTAADIVNHTDEQSLANLIFEYGEERASRRIARFIIDARKRERFTTTQQLAQVVLKALYRPGKKKQFRRIHPATRTFQALRIAVNHELDNLKQLLLTAPSLLGPSGRLAVISFHSLEDRIVKYNFKENKCADVYKILTKKPLVADESEVDSNRRSRSAKLRIAERL